MVSLVHLNGRSLRIGMVHLHNFGGPLKGSHFLAF
jgi:hypothetical protein